MWGGMMDGEALRRAQSSTGGQDPNPHHREQPVQNNGGSESSSSSMSSSSSSNLPGNDPTSHDGTWGEHDAERLNAQEARLEYENLAKNLHHMHRTATNESGTSRARSRKSRRSFSFVGARTRTPSLARTTGSKKTAKKVHDGDDEDDVSDEDTTEGSDIEDFDLEEFMREGRFERNTDEETMKQVGVVYENLTVKGITSGAAFVRTVPDAVLGTFGPDLYNFICKFIPALQWRKPQTRELLHDFTGCVRNGEMMLVLGRPGSGCSTFLKAITNKRESYAAVEGDVSYGGITAERQRKSFRGEVTYNGEDDIHFASLSVWRTLTFALANKSKKGFREDIPVIAEALMRMFGISHTKYTQVGNEYIRGVSGGERKRVSIAETLASKATVIAWDNSTRGLDASTALDYARSLRIMTDVSKRTTLVTLYQAGEGIYEVMDKVLVIDQGRQIFSGPANKAKQYFIDLGFECPERQTTADFLTAVTDPNERRIRPGFEKRVPRTAEDLEKAFRASPNYQELLQDVASYKASLHETDYEDTKRFEGAVAKSKSKHVSEKSPYTIPFHHQVMACFKREAWLLLADKTSLYTQIFITVACAFLVGSLFYDLPSDTSGLFSRGGTVFFGVIFLGWLQLGELMKAVSGRDVVNRHGDYAFYRPSAVSLARVLLDLPNVFVQTCIFAMTLYFMTGLDVEAGKFWIYMLFVFTTTIMVTAMYRMFAALSPEIDTAIRFSVIGLNVLIIFTGYVISKRQLLSEFIWFGWIYWVNPLSYAFEGVLTNELSDQVLACASNHLVPQGPGIDPEYQGCAISGSSANSNQVIGSEYLSVTYDYSRSNLWRNFGAILGFTVLYIAITVIATENVKFVGGGGGSIIFKKSKKTVQDAKQASGPADEEKGAAVTAAEASTTSSMTAVPAPGATDKDDEVLEQITDSKAVFTWRDLEYTVPYRGAERRLLNKVNGYIKPGTLMALVGASGAGKTTLLNTLSQRQTVGVVKGDVLVDGKSLGVDFQRNTGFCLQGDIHDSTATIREAIEFSAILRQEASVPRAEKIAYVDKIMNLLELEDLSDAIIASLGVEQRKRLTIGVELAAKPSLLLFLDEPTSGLDAQSAYSIVRFLKKLSAAGQAIICTIHQPSSVLIEQFDAVLALNPGGNTFYFGPIGENGKDVIKYFGDRGVVCPPGKNIAEFILETPARTHRRPDGSKINWNKEWVQSPNAKAVIQEIENIKATSGSAPQEQSVEVKQSKFAASTYLQTMELTKRMFKQHWRDPSYIYGRFFVAVVFGIFNGFTFWKLGYTVQDMQNRMFTVFLIVAVPPTIVNAVVPKFWANNELWQKREYPSRIYGWVAFTTAQIISEIPSAIITGTLYWAVWYWPTGLPAESSVSGYTYLMTVLAFIYMCSWGQWICAFAPSYTVISNVLPFFFVHFGCFNGVVRPYPEMEIFWRSWMYWLNPATYWVGGMLAATLDGQEVQCSPEETAVFDAPPGQTCLEYAGAFAKQAGGYLLNPDASSDCQYCVYETGNNYLETINVYAEHKWRSKFSPPSWTHFSIWYTDSNLDLGIFIAFCISNWFLVYFFIYTVRIRGWSFGFGYIVDGFEKLVKKIKGSKKTSEKSEA